MSIEGTRGLECLDGKSSRDGAEGLSRVIDRQEKII